MFHSHLPYVLRHGRWPHGSDWLCEAAVDTYLPLVDGLRRLSDDGVPSPITLGITPVLANQLADATFAAELQEFFGHRLEACASAPEALAAGGDGHLIPLVTFWRDRLSHLRDVFDSTNGDLVAAFRGLQDAGRIELVSSAATHGYLPLLGRDESIRLQLEVGFAEHARLFGAPPRGCWIPECAYRPAGPWISSGGGAGDARPGIDDLLAESGFHYFFVDAHLAAAGAPLGAYADVPLGAERFDGERHGGIGGHRRSGGSDAVVRSPYQAYHLAAPSQGRHPRAFVRDPRSSMQVWSRQHGYPGDGVYLEFHKIRWPGGLKLWRVTGPHADLGDKQPYDVAAAFDRAAEHAAHFAGLLGRTAAEQQGSVIVAPFDTELFGHWWFEGVHFVTQLYRQLAARTDVRAVTGSDHLRTSPGGRAIRLGEGSWGANGDHSMWLNPDTRWTWERLWPLEQRFWDVVPLALRVDSLRPILAQAAREMLLAQSSDWQFIISTGVTADYGIERFERHCSAAETLVESLERDDDVGGRARAAEVAATLAARDAVFPAVLDALARVLERSNPPVR
ncbi:MAG TPA: 1,4-alpha-glucan branching protein domain-containing protein [Gemmatimonadales bacterium]